MKAKHILLLLLPAVLAGCATSSTGGDAVHQQRMAELEQARADGTYPLTEKQFTYPNWPGMTAPRQAVAP